MIVWLLVFLLVQFCAGVEDAWIVNITSHIFGFDWQPEDNLGDKNSKKFLEHQSNFCGAVSQIFTAKPVIGNPVKERFQKCFIDRFVLSNQLHVIEAPVLLSYILVFNGSEPIPKPLVDAAYIASSELYTIKDRVWTLIGDIWLTNRQNVEMTRANLSNYLVSFSENAHNTSQGDFDTVVDFKGWFVNFTMTPETFNVSSQEFKQLSHTFCEGVSRFFADKNLSLKRCILQTLSKGIADQDENTANFSSSLEFDGQRVLPPDDLRYMIMASVHGKAFENNTVVMVSSSSVVDTSLTSKAAVTIQSEANPCFPNKTNIYLPDPVDPASFIICNKGKGHHVKCDPPKIFLAKIQRCVKTL